MPLGLIATKWHLTQVASWRVFPICMTYLFWQQIWHSIFIPYQYIGILLYQFVNFNYVMLCMILPSGRLGWVAMQEILLYWSGMTIDWKCVEKPWLYHGEWNPLESPLVKTLWACGPSGFGLGTSLGTPFTIEHPRLFHTLSQYRILKRIKQFWSHGIALILAFIIIFYKYIYMYKYIKSILQTPPPHPRLSTSANPPSPLHKRWIKILCLTLSILGE